MLECFEMSFPKHVVVDAARERNGMMSATDVMPRAKLKMSISRTAQVFFISSRAVALHLCLAFNI
jgi:hypothetical protein